MKNKQWSMPSKLHFQRRSIFYAFKRERAEKSFGSKCSRKSHISYIWVDWLNYSYSRVEYVERELEIKQEFAESGGKYLEEKLLSTIREKIFSPRLENRIIPPIGKTTIVSQ